MNSEEMEGNQNHRRKVVKKEKKRNWVKQTRMIQERVGSVVSTFFGSKKSQPVAIRSSNAIGKSSNTQLGRSVSKRGPVKVSKTRTFLSNLFRKGKIKKISTKGQSESGQEKENHSNLARVSSRRVSTKPKLKIARSVRNRGISRVGGEFEPSDEDPGNELCKRRILMGGKCKPLENSGFLHYDHNGVFSER